MEKTAARSSEGLTIRRKTGSLTEPKIQFWGNLAKEFRLGIIRALSTEIGIVAGLSVLIYCYNALLVTGYQDFQGAIHDPIQLIEGLSTPLTALPLEPFSLSSPALGLLLVFWTNAS
jgi:putative membrane protein